MYHLVVISNMSGLKGRYNNFSIEQQWLDPDSPSRQSHVLSSVKRKEVGVYLPLLICKFSFL